ncbi:MAG: UpxY family transcription antiterminator [Candidatus Brocadiaceae bacterium]|nr:UpxY family transcription antiterminator [Candidatus Brocadiaceae bacterium]
MDRDSACWFAVHTRSRHEKQVDLLLKEKNIETFLPLIETPSRRKDRKKFIDLPLFPGYLFVNTSANEIYKIVSTRGIVRVLGEDSITPTPIPEKQVAELKILVSSKVKLDPYKFLKSGTRIRVIAGPLKGVEGFLLKRKSNYRVIVSIDLLQKAASAEVCIEDIESID